MGALRLTLLRHAQAQSIDSCAEDFERVLTKRGEIDAREIAARIVKRDLLPDLMLVSPAERAWLTAEFVARACELDARQVLGARELYLATPETTWKSLRAHAGSATHVLICGHNPGLSHIASRFGPHPERREMPTAGLVSAVWKHGDWQVIEPETADGCEADDPQSAGDPW